MLNTRKVWIILTKRELSQSQTAKPLQIQPPCPLSGILYFTCVILKCNSIFTSSSNSSNSSDRNRKVRFNPLPSPVLFLWRDCAARLLYVPCFFFRHVQKICNEDPNLLILESNDCILTEDDSLPLYQTSFSERNILRVTFLVLFPSSSLFPEHSRVGSPRSPSRARKPRKNREIRPAHFASVALPRFNAAKRAFADAAARDVDGIAESAEPSRRSLDERHSVAAEPIAGRHAAFRGDRDAAAAQRGVEAAD